MAQELIKHAAVIAVEGMIFLGKSHADCFKQAAYVNFKTLSGRSNQGFFTSHGRYVDREDGFRIALKAAQIEDVWPAEILFSEMMWSPTDNGKHNYNTIEGYTPK